MSTVDDVLARLERGRARPWYDRQVPLRTHPTPEAQAMIERQRPAVSELRAQELRAEWTAIENRAWLQGKLTLRDLPRPAQIGD